MQCKMEPFLYGLSMVRNTKELGSVLEIAPFLSRLSHAPNLLIQKYMRMECKARPAIETMV